MTGLRIEVPSYVLVYDKKRLRKVLRQAGNEVASVARSLIRSAVGAGKPNKAGSRRSAPGQPPVSQSGLLAGSIKVRPSRDGLSVGIKDSAYYALFLETGAKGGGGRKGNRSRRGQPSSPRVLAPRPFLEVALQQRAQSLTERLQASLRNDIEFKRIK